MAPLPLESTLTFCLFCFSPEVVQFEQEYVKGGCGGGVSKWQLYLPPSSTSVGWLGPKLGGPPCRNLVKRPNGLVFTQNLPGALGLSCFFCHIWDLFAAPPMLFVINIELMIILVTVQNHAKRPSISVFIIFMMMMIMIMLTIMLIVDNHVDIVYKGHYHHRHHHPHHHIMPDHIDKFWRVPKDHHI